MWVPEQQPPHACFSRGPPTCGKACSGRRNSRPPLGGFGSTDAVWLSRTYPVGDGGWGSGRWRGTAPGGVHACRKPGWAVFLAHPPREWGAVYICSCSWHAVKRARIARYEAAVAAGDLEAALPSQAGIGGSFHGVSFPSSLHSHASACRPARECAPIRGRCHVVSYSDRLTLGAVCFWRFHPGCGQVLRSGTPAPRPHWNLCRTGTRQV